MNLTIDLLTPNEVAEITNISAENQRNMRRSGYLPKNSGHARFTLHDTARLLVIGLMAERGIGPKISVTFADTAARGIVLSLLYSSEIYSESAAVAAHLETETEAVEGIARVRLTKLTDLNDSDILSFKGSIAKNYLAEKIAATLGMQGEKRPNFFCLWANNHPEFFYDDEHPWEDVDYSLPAWQGPVIMFSIGAVAALMASRLPRSIVHAVEDK